MACAQQRGVRTDSVLLIALRLISPAAGRDNYFAAVRSKLSTFTSWRASWPSRMFEVISTRLRDAARIGPGSPS